MSEPTKEAIECSSDEARRLAAPHSYTRVTTRIPIVREIVFTQYGLAQFITQLRKQAREDALETVRQCERRSGACVMVHSLLNPEHPNLCNEENCSSIRAMNRL